MKDNERVRLLYV